MKLTYLSHSVFILEKDGFKAIFDPFITGNPLAKVLPIDINNITHIFVSHGHQDHLGDTIDLANANDALVITNAEIAGYLSTFGIDTHPMHIGGRYKFDFGSVKLTPALHGSSIETDEGILYGGSPCGFLIEMMGKKIYYAGDTGLSMDMKLLRDDGIDIAILPIGGNYTMDIDDAVKAVKLIEPKLAIPMHYNTFPLIKADPLEFKKKNIYSETKVFDIGESYSF